MNFFLKKGILLQKLGKKMVVYDNDNSTLHEFNEVGFLALSLMEKGKNEAQIVKRIVEKFRVSKEAAKEDLKNFFDLLKKKGLLAKRKEE